jgi:hypothetical protein
MNRAAIVMRARHPDNHSGEDDERDYLPAEAFPHGLSSHDILAANFGFDLVVDCFLFRVVLAHLNLFAGGLLAGKNGGC